MANLFSTELDEVLSAVGEHLEAAGESVAIVVVGGASLIAGRWIDRATKDVDVIARVDEVAQGGRLIPPDPLPAALQDAIRRVARDYRLSEHWLNTEIAAQWKGGLPPGLEDEIRWKTFGTLTVGFAGRTALLALKLFAAIDRGPDSVHYQDLLALDPAREELDGAAGWVATQDAGEQFARQVSEVVEHVCRDLEQSGDARS